MSVKVHDFVGKAPGSGVVRLMSALGQTDIPLSANSGRHEAIAIVDINS